MKIALLQENYVVADIQGNARRILAGVERARCHGVGLVVTSELALTGYPPRDRVLSPGFVADAESTLQALVERLPPEMAVIVGTILPRQGVGRPLWNAAVWIQGGTIQSTTAKVLLPNYDVFAEERYFASWPDPPPVMDWGGYRWGVTICEDMWNPEGHKRRYHRDPVAELAQAGATHILNLSASPFEHTKLGIRWELARTHCRTHGLWLGYVNQVGGNDQLVFDGRSFVCSPQGEIVAQAAAFQPDLLIVHKCGFSQVLVGLSGGIDSSVTAVIAVAALGSANVTGVLLPSPYSSTSSVVDALALAEKLGIPTVKIPIQRMMDSFSAALGEVLSNPLAGVTAENLQSRIRGTVLMALSNQWGRLLLTTGNKSELAVGYCTLYGDMSGALAVIGDLYKTQVYALARWINRDQEIIPWNCLHKPPSAELRPGQTDQDSLPPYEILDAILQKHLEDHASATDLIAAGGDPELVQRVLTLVHRAEFKRRQAPPCVQVSPRAFGIGWQMPIAAR
jgi:NAD+ synthase (glutamine-hydrolysing)